MGRDIVESLIRAIHERLGLLDMYRTPALAGWRDDPLRVAAAEHLLQTAIQAAIDICCHMLADKGLGAGDSYAATLRQWAQTFDCPPQLAAALARMAGLRNLLVHEYGRIDVTQLESVIAAHLDDFRSFIAMVLQTDMFNPRGTDKQ